MSLYSLSSNYICMILLQLVRLCVGSDSDPYQTNCDGNCFYVSMLNGISSKEKYHNTYVTWYIVENTMLLFVYISMLHIIFFWSKSFELEILQCYIMELYFLSKYMVCCIFSKVWKIKTYSYIGSIPEYILNFTIPVLKYMKINIYVLTNNSKIQNHFFGICNIIFLQNLKVER